MSFLELAEKRCSIRGYEDRPVSEDAVRQILEACRLAPSAANRQPWHVIVVQSREQREALAACYGPEWFWQAPIILVLCVEPGVAWTRSDGKNYVDVDGAIAMDHMTLCAADLGLGTCWIGAFHAEKARRILSLPEGVEPLAMTPLGIPAKEPRPKTRKPIEEIVHFEKW